MSSDRPPVVSDLAELERRFQAAFRSGSDAPLEVIGYGEISSVVRWKGDTGPVAAKRLPNYVTREARRQHRALMVEYIAALDERGLTVLPTEFYELDAADGSFVLYAVQALIASECLAVSVLRHASPEEGEALLRSIITRAAAVAGEPRYGLDVQLANWVVVEGQLDYFDISTPFIREVDTGISRLDTSIFVVSLPWLLRWPVQRFLAEDIVAQFFDLRTTLIDAVANLRKERLDEWMEKAIEIAGTYVDEPIRLDEVDRYYSKDRRLWTVLQWLRRADRWWQLRVRRRPYPVLLPGRIDR